MKKKLTTRITILAISLGWISIINPIAAQEHVALAGIHFQVGVPHGAFEKAFDKTGYGGGLDIYFKVKRDLPYYVGTNISLMGFEQYRRDFVVGLPGNFVEDYRLRVGSSLFSGYLGFKVMPDKGWFRPYTEALIGFKNFYRSARLDYQPRFSNSWEEVNRNTDGDLTLGYGGSVGARIFFGQSGIALDLKCTYLAGGRARTFQLNDDINLDDFEVDPFSAFTSTKTATNMIIPQIGVVFLINPIRPAPIDEIR
jgi:hypothetical protein